MEEFKVENLGDGSVIIELDINFYSREAILETSYYFLDKCYVNLKSYGDGIAKVIFSPKDTEGSDLSLIVKDFSNKLIDQQLRFKINQETKDIKKLIVKEAFAPLENMPESDNS